MIARTSLIATFLIVATHALAQLQPGAPAAGHDPAVAARNTTAIRSCATRIPAATRPCNEAVSALSSSTFVATTVLEKRSARAISRDRDSSNP